MKLKMLFASLGTCMICGANAFSLFYSDAIVNKDKYSVMGVDVAHYQGVIDWNKLEEQGVDFAFIKATEGSGHVDCFSKSTRHIIFSALTVPVKLRLKIIFQQLIKTK